MAETLLPQGCIHTLAPLLEDKLCPELTLYDYDINNKTRKSVVQRQFIKTENNR